MAGRKPGAAWLLLGSGGVAAAAAAGADPGSARAAAGQDWPPFVLVAGLLLVGLAAAEDGLFAAAGQLLARATDSGWKLYGGVVALIVAVTAVLNLDTSVAFLSPVLVHTARRREEEEGILLCACILLSNAGSLLLPGSNLTNLIVLGHLHLSGGKFAQRMGLPWVAAVAVTAGVLAVAAKARLSRHSDPDGVLTRPRLGVGALAAGTSTILVIVSRSPALPVAMVGLIAVALEIRAHRISWQRALEVLGLPVLLGLLGVAVGLGVAGRDWTAPARLMGHLDSWATAAVAAVAAVALNNLPAASLLAARAPAHPFALLVGLDVGPNLFVSGSLSWILWLRSSRAAGGIPPLRRAVAVGAVSVPLAVAAAVAVLAL